MRPIDAQGVPLQVVEAIVKSQTQQAPRPIFTNLYNVLYL